MSSESKDHRTKAQLLEEVETLRRRLEEAEQTIEAIRQGDVDALVVAGPRGEQVFSITGAEHIYRVIVETMNEAAVTVDPDGTVLFCNQRFCDLMKMPIHEVIGRKVTDFAARPQRPSLQAMLRDGQIGAIQRRVTLRATDGTAVPVQISANPLQIDGATSICLVASDLTELEASANSIRVLREHQQALEESESRFRMIFESSQDAIAIANDEGICVQANPAVQAIFGLPPEQLVGRRISDVMDQTPDFSTLWQTFLTTGTFHGELPLTGADGQTHYIEASAVANILPGRHLAVIRDTTERKQAQEALQSANTQLQIQTEELKAQTEELQIANEELGAREEELRAANEALRKSEERYHRLFEDDLTGNVISTPEGKILLCNPAFARIFGFSSADEAVGTNILELYVDPTEREPLLERLRQQRKTERLEVWRRRRDGEPVYIVENLVGHFNERGELYEIKGYIFDDTERKRAEEALRESRERLERAQEIAHLGSWELDLVSNRLTWSDEVYRIFGLQPQEFGATYEAFLDHVHPEDRAAVDAAYSGSLREGRDTYEIEHRIVRRSTGEVRIVHEKCEHVRDASGRGIRSVGMVHDITERKQAEEALRMSEEKFRTLHALSPIAIVLNRLDNGQFLESNQALWGMTGYTEEEFRSLTYWDITPIDYKEMEAKQLELLHTVGRYGPYEKEYIRKDGSRFPVLLSGVRIKDPSGTDLIYSVIQDITELKAKEQALRELNATLEAKVAQRTAELQYRARQLQKLALELSQAEDLERKRIAEILHDDLQQILAAAKFHLNSLRSRARYDPSIQATAAQIDHMLKDAIDKSRALSHELSPAVLHHGDFRDTLGWLAGQIQTKHGLIVRVDAFSRADVQSDALRAFLYKAAQELLFNVVKHARVNEARIRIRRWGQCICLSVSDRGRGFDPQDLKATTGFGLFSIRERVELLGGRMKIKSSKGHGSTFHIVVPDGELIKKAATVEPADLAKETKPAQGEGQRRLRVLIADDHEIVREGLISLLSDEHSIQVVGEAANGREAVDLSDQLRPDVVIMDVAMPLIDGDEATRQIKRHMPDTRVIALSMYEEHENVEKMLAAGAEAYILKTAPAEELLAVIRGTTPGG